VQPQNDPPNNTPELEVEMDETINILEEEAEATPEQESASAPADQASEQEYQPGDGLAPFEGAPHDPGLEGLDDLVEGEEAPAAPEPIVYRDLSPTELQAAVEAAIFMQQKPITVNRLRELINPGIHEEEYRTAISNLMATYFDESRGLELVEVANGFQLRTKAEHKDIIRRMYQIAPMKLTNAMLEVLAIVAYNQPLTREGVDKIRGVDSSHLLRVLLDKKMLRIAGKSDTVGNPMIYATTKEFLELFGLRDLSALPTLRELEEMLPKNEVGSISEEEALAQEMEGIVTASKPVDFNDLELEGWDEEEEKRELLGADDGAKGPSWKERLKVKKAEEQAAAPAQQELTNDEQPQTTEERQERDPQETPQAAPSGPDGDGGPALDLRPEEGGEAAGDADLPPEVAGRITPGQEGHA
jgi:segregation and condensation protein B